MKKELQDLIFKGYTEDAVDVYGMKFVLITLNSKQNLECYSETQNYDPYSRTFALKISILSRALKMVETTKVDSQEEAKEFLEGLQEYIVNELFDKYAALKERQMKSLGEIKN